eukprot:3835702-Amphidinium_carterae.1
MFGYIQTLALRANTAYSLRKKLAPLPIYRYTQVVTQRVGEKRIKLSHRADSDTFASTNQTHAYFERDVSCAAMPFGQGKKLHSPKLRRERSRSKGTLTLRAESDPIRRLLLRQKVHCKMEECTTIQNGTIFSVVKAMDKCRISTEVSF